MPVYEFKCGKCGHLFELMLPMNSEKNQTCPSCGKTASRIISAAAGFVVNSSSAGRNAMNCGQQSPCCGREIPCDSKPCER